MTCNVVRGSIATLDVESRSACLSDVSVIFCRLCKTFGKTNSIIGRDRSKSIAIRG